MYRVRDLTHLEARCRSACVQGEGSLTLTWRHGVGAWDAGGGRVWLDVRLRLAAGAALYGAAHVGESRPLPEHLLQVALERVFVLASPRVLLLLLLLLRLLRRSARTRHLKQAHRCFEVLK